MTLGHRNRIRRTGGNRLVFELETAEPFESAALCSAGAEVERPANAFYLNPGVAIDANALFILSTDSEQACRGAMMKRALLRL